MDSPDTAPSPHLLEANQRLLALRKQHKAASLVAAQVCRREGAPPWETAVSADSMPTAEKIAALSAHLGWESAAVTVVLRQRQQRVAQELDGGQTAILTPNDQKKPPSHEKPTSDTSTGDLPARDWVKLYPDIGLAMLRQEQTASGRLWLLLRCLDGAGRGLFRIDILSSHLTDKSSTLRFCGKRQLRNLLKAGEGLYWTRDKTRIWLRSAARVAFALGVERLSGRPVALPLSALLDGIGDFRGHLYAAFHSGRVKETRHGSQAMPIARDTLAKLSGVGRSSQRNYENRIGIDVQANFVVGEKSTKEAMEKRAWAKGQALFELKDYRGQQGRKGKTYLAWQLPNSYFGQHQHRPKGRQKRINRELRDLVMKGMPGNGEVADEPPQIEKRYFPNGKLAARAYGRCANQPLYWHNHRTRNGIFSIWQCLGG